MSKVELNPRQIRAALIALEFYQKIASTRSLVDEGSRDHHRNVQQVKDLLEALKNSELRILPKRTIG